MSIRRFEGRSAMVRGVVWLCCLPLVLGNGALVAQTPAAQAPATTAKPAPQAGSGAAQTATKLNNDQLDSLVAPVALYPDPLLSQALVASTYPLELVQAQQWLAKNTTLKGDALSSAVEKQDWDPSVQATVVVPDLLKRLTEDISWTHNLGNAFLEQPDDVMNAVQRLRSKAKTAGKLETTEQQKVETTVVETKTVIEIQPTSTQVVYVPTYSPTVIWGPMYYPYPPIYYPPYPPGAAWIGFGVGVAVGIGISGGWGYGCRWGGGGNNIYINNNNNFVRNNNIRTGNINTGNINRGNSNWQHNPSHRGGAPYSNTATASKYGGSTRGGGSSRAGGASATGASRASGGASAPGASRSAGGASAAGASRSSGGGDRVGSRSVPQTSTRSGGSAFGGASGGASGASRASGASSRGASSMGSRGGGGGRRR